MCYSGGILILATSCNPQIIINKKYTWEGLSEYTPQTMAVISGTHIWGFDFWVKSCVLHMGNYSKSKNVP